MKTSIKLPNKKEASLAASAMGRLGGRAVAKRGKKYMKEIGLRGANARWAKEKNKNKKSNGKRGK